MKLVVLGANGRTGKLVVQEALEMGETVTAVVRSEAKKLDIDALLAFRDRFDLPLSDQAVEALEFCKPSDNSD